MMIYQTFADAYQNIVKKLLYYYEYETSPRGMKIYEITNCKFSILNPYSNLFKNEVRKYPKKYLAGELVWYFTNDLSVEWISKFSKFWKKITNDNNEVNSNYGYLLFKEKNEYGLTEWEWAVHQLINDKYTRQAIIRFNKPRHSYINNKDFVCTMYGIFQIRNNKLNFTIHMRSNDIMYGLTFDFPFFSILQQEMLLRLKKYYPDLEMGIYTHFVNSLHLYEKDKNLLENGLNTGFYSDELPKVNESLISNIHIFKMKELYYPLTYDKLVYWIWSNMNKEE